MRIQARVAAAMIVLSAALPAAAQVQGDVWSDVPGLQAVPDATAMVATDADTLYVAVRSILMPVFQRYSGTTKSWTTMAAPPLPAGTLLGRNARMTHRPGTPYLYLVRAANSAHFYEYDMTADTWRTLADLPFVVMDSYVDHAMAATSSKVYIFGDRSAAFYEYTPSAGAPGTWLAKAKPVVPGGSWYAQAYWLTMTNAGNGTDLYAIPDRGTWMWRYSTTNDTWTQLGTRPGFSTQLFSQVVGNGSESLYALFYGTNSPTTIFSATFHRYDIATAQWSDLPAVPSYLMGSACLAAPLSGGDTVSLATGYTADVLRFSVSANAFASELAQPPTPVYFGAMTGVGDGEHVYLSNGGAGFHRYSISADEWTTLATQPADGLYGYGLAYPGAGDFLYATRGASNFRATPTADFYRYSISTNAWTALAPLPVTVDRPGRLIHAGGTRLLALTAEDATVMYRYDIDTDTWTATAPLTAGTFEAGMNLCWPGSGDVVYVIRGATQDFMTYSLATDTWSPLGPLPVAAGVSTSMVHAGGGDRLFAFLNESSSTLWSYSIGDATWTAHAPAPGTPKLTQGLAFPGGHTTYLYAAKGDSTPSFWRYTMDNPPILQTLSQFRLDGVTPLPPGWITSGETGFKASVSAANPLADGMRLEVEVKPVGAAFTGTATVSSAGWLPGPVISLPVTGLALPASYHWRARLFNETGFVSAWRSFGTNPENLLEVDVRTRNNSEPQAAAPGQFLASTGGEIGVGASISETSIRFEATVTDPDGDAAVVEVEIATVGQAFTGTPTLTLAAVAGAGSASAAQDLNGGGYRWRLRAADLYGARGPWIDFGRNGAEEADFLIFPDGSGGKSACPLSAGSRAATSPVALLAAIAFAAVAGRRRGVAALLLLAGCGPGSGGGDSPAAPAAPELAIVPASSYVPHGRIVQFSIDGLPAGETVTWSSTKSSVAAISATGRAVALSQGRTTIRATTSGGASLSAPLAVDYEAPTAIFGGSEQLLTWTPEGGEPSAVVEASGKGCPVGIASVPGGIYVLFGGYGVYEVCFYDPAAKSLVSKGAIGGIRLYDLAVDSLGRFYALDGGTSDLVRYDPATGSQVTLCSLPMMIPGALAIDEHDNLYAQDVWTSGTWVYKITPAGALTPLVAAPCEVMCAGFAVIRDGGPIYLGAKVESGGSESMEIFRAEDTNHDGGLYDVSSVWSRPGYYYGMYWTGESILVNEPSRDGFVPSQIHRLTDWDGDGVFSGEGEATVWSGATLYGDTGAVFGRLIPK